MTGKGSLSKTSIHEACFVTMLQTKTATLLTLKSKKPTTYSCRGFMKESEHFIFTWDTLSTVHKYSYIHVM